MAEQFLKYIVKKSKIFGGDSVRLHILFDKYEDDTTKNQTRPKRASEEVFTNSLSNMICKPHPTGRESLKEVKLKQLLLNSTWYTWLPMLDHS